MKIYNTQSKTKEELQPLKKGRIGLFVCGPTVYDDAHLGHARTSVFFDMMAKYLKSLKYKVYYIQNITDIDDKIIQRAKENNAAPQEIAKKFTKRYLEDMELLGINSVNKYAPATPHIKEIVRQIKKLLKKGFAYQAGDGVYFATQKFKRYGQLAGRTTEQAEDSFSRIDISLFKKTKADFCLWKLSKGNEPSWKSPFGEGRPGWHIEDTAIAEKYLGCQYDIHGGALDLIFPHHEAEIAQMEAASGKRPMVKYWVHTGFLTVDGKKMAKSLGNFITIRNFTKQYGTSALRTLRYLFLKTHYRSPIDYSAKAVVQAKKELEKIDEVWDKIKRKKFPSGTRDSGFEQLRQEFGSALQDDFNTPQAMATVFEAVSRVNKAIAADKGTKFMTDSFIKWMKEADKYFGFLFDKDAREIPEPVSRIIKERQEARENKNWQKADTLRIQLESMGYHIEDTSEGVHVKKV